MSFAISEKLQTLNRLINLFPVLSDHCPSTPSTIRWASDFSDAMKSDGISTKDRKVALPSLPTKISFTLRNLAINSLTTKILL